ncbi:MAG TPA: exodeoxyribonuclease VII large subunit [Gemmatimonadaceae bacterium]|nr:exodeoxyribonuclease VII large subunit [Gemmatimonadaceae bacterium]
MSTRRRGGSPSQSLGELELFAPPPPPPPRSSAPRSSTRESRAVPPPPPREERVEDAIPGGSPGAAVSVMALTATARDVLEGAFMPLWVRGEVSDFKAHRNGHWYFCLRDADAQIRCVAWSRDRRIPARPDDGMQVAAFGQLSVYPARGEMQFSVTRMEAEGDGLYRKALDLTRARLEADGLLDPGRKRPIPRYPRRIAVITSRDGAALRDIHAVVQRRCPAVDIVLVPAAVQGDTAPDSLCDALDRVARWGKADVVIIGRGGGSREDLWAFNDERVARALARCPMPTISAVGHEIDMSICDLVADLRAPTPSAAAEAAVPVQAELRERLRAFGGLFAGLSADHVARARIDASTVARRLSAGAVRHRDRRRIELEAAAGRLNALSPLATLERGYAIVRTTTGKTVRSASALGAGESVDLVFRDGVTGATVDRVVSEKPETAP